MNSFVIKRNYCESLALWKPTFSAGFQVKSVFRKKFIGCVSRCFENLYLLQAFRRNVFWDEIYCETSAL